MRGAGGERRSIGELAAALRRDMVVEPVGLVVGDDDGTVSPVWTVGDVAHSPGRERLGDLLVGVGRVVVISQEGMLDGRRGINGNQPIVVVVAAAQVEDAAAGGQGAVFNRVEEVLCAMQVIVQDLRVVGEIAEILWAVVMQDVPGVQSPGRWSGLGWPCSAAHTGPKCRSR